jgi:hypothetical protein
MNIFKTWEERKLASTPYAVVLDKDALSITELSEKEAAAGNYPEGALKVVPNSSWLRAMYTLLESFQRIKKVFSEEISFLADGAKGLTGGYDGGH